MSTENSKSFWKRPEGKPGMVILAALILGGGYLLYNVLPSIIELMKNTYIAIGLFTGLFAIASIVMNDKFRATVWYLYTGLMRWFTGLAIELNPIAILESYVADIKKKLEKMDEQLTSLKGQIGKIKGKLDANKAEWKKNMEKAEQATRLGRDKAEIILYTRQAGRLEEYVNKLDSLFKRMEILYNVLSKMKYYSEIMVKDTEMTVAIKKEEREAITKSHSIMKAAMGIINGNGDKKAIFDQAMEFVVDDIGFKVGEMDRMLEASTDFMNSVDLDNAVYEEKGAKMLEEFDKRGMDAIFGAPKALNQGSMNADLSQFTTPTPVKNESKSTGNKGKYF